jgi:hypothetical protein
MERLLELYRAPYDAYRPVICMDEMSKQLIAETRRVLPVQEGQPKRFDYEYERKGVCQVLLFCEPLRGWRKGFVRQHRAMCDWAWCVRELLEVDYPEATCVRLVMDNLNTHTRASLYQTLAPADALRLLQRLEFYYTPKHGSWLNMAEIELSVLAKQCLDRRLEEQRCVAEEVSAWETQRNEQEAKVRWRFTVSDARVKLKKIYPSISI